MKTKTLLFSLAVFISYSIVSAQTSYGNLNEGNAGNGGGSTNSYFGYLSGSSNTGFFNTFIGYRSGFQNTTASGNIFIGTNSGFNNTSGNNNTFIGRNSGYNNQTGSGNIFLGYLAGINETGSNLLYIDNSNTSSPLIWGNFANDIVNFNANVGIGTITPAYALDVVGTFQSDYIRVNAQQPVGTEGGEIRLAGTDIFPEPWLIDHYSGRFRLHSAGTTHFAVDENGNVGIGTTYPTYPLDVVGILQSDYVRVNAQDPASTEGGQIQLDGTAMFPEAWNIDHYEGRFRLHSAGTTHFVVNGNGNVGIGTAFPVSGYGLTVAGGGILSEKVKVAVNGSANWSDYVFEDDYNLKPLSEVEAFVKENKHLPGIPSAEEMVKEGLDVAQMDAKLLEKIEELTLYMIEMKKEIEVLKKENTTLQTAITNSKK